MTDNTTPTSGVSLRFPLGSKSSGEGDLADVLAVGLSGELGSSFDQSQFVVGEPDRDHVSSRVVGLGSAGSRGHDTTIAYTETLDQADLSVYDKSMTTSRYIAVTHYGSERILDTETMTLIAAMDGFPSCTDRVYSEQLAASLSRVDAERKVGIK